jgi:hypothetical protein
MCRVLAYVLMLCLVMPLPVMSAPNPNENALENASDNARFNREDDVQKGKRDKRPGADDDEHGRLEKMLDDDDDLDKKDKDSKKDRDGKKDREGKKERDGKKSKGGKNKKK